MSDSAPTTTNADSRAGQRTGPPVAPRVPHRRTHHGDTFVDDFEWLRDKESAETLEYLEAENAYTAAQTAHLGGLREAIFDEIKARTQETDLSVPSRTGTFWYYSRTSEGAQYPVMCRLPVRGQDDWEPPTLIPGEPADGEQVLLDCNVLAEGQPFFSLGAFAVSESERFLAYSTDVVGDERYTIRILDIDAGTHGPDLIEGTLSQAVWSNDGTVLFYSTVDESWRPDTVWRHEVGTPGSTDDVVVFHEDDDRFWVSVSATTSHRFVLVESGSRITSETRVLDADAPGAEPRVVFARESGVEYSVEHLRVGDDDRWVVVHNKDALNFAVGIGPLDVSSINDLEVVVPASAEVRIGEAHTSQHALVLALREDGLPQVRVFSVGSNGLADGHRIAFDEAEFSAGAQEFSDWRCPLVRLSYTSWITPRTVLDYDPRTRTRLMRKQVEVPGYAPGRFLATREWVVARDGTRVPVSFLHHEDVQPRSGGPLLLYGYGSYEISSDPRFAVSTLSLLERGFVFATAHVRGGGEMGRQWYEDGKLLAKKHTFDDFVDCARYVVDTGWTTSERLAAHGGSAGGLLMGAVANQAPDLFGAIVAHVPFVDALTTILDPELPLTVIEWDEWGDPLHDPDVYAYMKSYTPYENVQSAPYPAIYALTSINDTRVYYVEPAKWVAELRRTTTGHRPILLKCEMSAGHGGASGRYDFWHETADYLAWVVDTVGTGSVSAHFVGPAHEPASPGEPQVSRVL
jgi:oligopeptidase B